MLLEAAGQLIHRLVVCDIDKLFVILQPLANKRYESGHLLGRVLFVTKTEVPPGWQAFDLLR